MQTDQQQEHETRVDQLEPQDTVASPPAHRDVVTEGHPEPAQPGEPDPMPAPAPEAFQGSVQGEGSVEVGVGPQETPVVDAAAGAAAEPVVEADAARVSGLEPEPQSGGAEPEPTPAPKTAAPPAPGEKVLSAELQAEIDEAMEALGLEEPKPQRQDPGPLPNPEKPKLRGPRKVEGGREHRSGVVVSVGPTDVFLEFGPKELGVIDRQQFKKGDEEKLPNVGESVEVVVQRFEPSESLYICVLPGSVQKADWELLQSGQVIEARVSGVNKGGLELEVGGHRAFMPASQVDVDHVPDLSVFVGEKLECRVQRIDRRGKGNIVLSRREVLSEQRAKAAESLKESLQEGQTVEGRVRKIMDFGAFVDLGGIDGLIHISDLSHERVNHGAKNVARHVSEGQEIRVQVLSVDWDANRISLGLKQLSADPFEAAASEVVEGAEVTGKVVKLVEFGAFVEVAPGVEGLVHISELDHRRVAAPGDVVQEGEVVQVKVLKIDPGTRKVSLSIKALKDAPPPPKGAGPRGGPGGGGGRGRGRGDRDDRSPDEILKETPQLRRLREQAKKKQKDQEKNSLGGLGDVGGLGEGLGSLKL